ncbi:hypothetical protein ACTGJ9_038200 [Bradyrhizobium sp. RDM12]
MNVVEPLLRRPTASTVFIGKNGCGNWVVREQNGLFGGLFISRAEAFKYALSKNGQHAGTIFEIWSELGFLSLG